MDRAKKKFASAIDGLRSFTNRTEIVVNEKIQPEHCTFVKIVRHGFPDDARCLAYDAIQRLLAIGTGHGAVRILGKFANFQGGLITVCGNDMIHLWNYRQKIPEIVHSIQLNKEAVTCIHLPIGSKWLYVGTDKGNIYFVSVGTFQLSSYVINWNKAIDLSSRVHPGSVRQIGASPHEPTKLLIVFEKGALIQWNLVTKEVDRFPLDPPIKCFSWHYEGKLLMTGNVDGSICVYNLKKISRFNFPFLKNFFQFLGMPTEDGLPAPAITFLRASKSATVLEMDHPILSFVTLPQVPFNSCPQQPQALATLLKGELMVIDLQMPG
ncbi:LLGL2 protein [Dictyocaulus viviparus]|uniref:LLGL2 protein n=1 Tax=Dictyocaulus viviparus TaxID=29172 RepID=A0A0D8YFS6_DICVI|nr:LLGL2 protein [Dictyocaulus viviparus]